MSTPNIIAANKPIDILAPFQFICFSCIKNIFTILLYYKVIKRFDTFYIEY